MQCLSNYCEFVGMFLKGFTPPGSVVCFFPGTVVSYKKSCSMDLCSVHVQYEPVYELVCANRKNDCFSNIPFALVCVSTSSFRMFSCNIIFKLQFLLLIQLFCAPQTSTMSEISHFHLCAITLLFLTLGNYLSMSLL